MIVKLNNRIDSIAEEIVGLQMKSYSVEAEIIGCKEIPPLKDTIDTINKCDEVFYGYYIDESLAGMISYKLEDETLDIYRMAVAPEHFRKGIAKKLINHIESINSNINKVIVSTGKDNMPAVKLYEHLGFKKIEDQEVVKGLWITKFEKLID